MPVQFRPYTDRAGVTPDYERVRAFLVKRGYSEFTYARWDWMATHTYLDREALGRIGLWEEHGEIVGAALYDCEPGDTFLITLPAYRDLRGEMLAYAEERLRASDGSQRFPVPVTDLEYQELLARNGYIATPSQECDAAFYPRETAQEYRLPEGFSVTDLQETPDAFQYGRVLWNGFDHERNGEGPYPHTAEKTAELRAELFRPHVDLSLKIAVAAPNGDFASYCGLWYEPEAGFAVIEPLATDPAYRLLGLGKAAALEGIRRVAARGARLVLVGSSQQFYYSIGMRPYGVSVCWRKRGSLDGNGAPFTPQ